MKMYVSFIILIFSCISYSDDKGDENPGSRLRDAEKPYFLDHDFSEGGYSILGISCSQGSPSASAESRNFYTDDIDILSKIKKEWVFTRIRPPHACGCDYKLYICKDNRIVESLSVNLGCNALSTNRGSFYIEENPLSAFEMFFKKPVVKKEEFTSLSEARMRFDTISNSKKLIICQKPEWYEHEGTFRFDYPYEAVSESRKDNEDNVLKVLRQQISSAYPGENYNIVMRGYSTQKGKTVGYIIEIQCDSTLEKKFTLYKKRSGAWGWKTYDLHLNSYWKK